ncbi:MAG: hypothetical protein A2846_02750 [Candidatus Doudnabacteria bacterium RIFCSPHIGHO2_01_FULL_49_9]|uniref:Glycoside hydrolase family 42 N-terminal domain-containing protein n=1 Tax=Candidatus Doudnabacteria bacterium RIFCSPHIGHO2_01_FULL_49_9 TaxID=1817827 RepID=A0A1F5P374_9BACT|nr:MAG: hypothetical protein A2846_02750 [Candidatus Doudnabacteria bacterium RIFCSPHIGHO2_01_FULL_49_9]
MIRFIKRVIILAILLAAAASWFFLRQFPPEPDPVFGLNFSLTHAQYLGFDWREMYIEILDEFQPKKLRVMALWEVVEPNRGDYNFQDIDYMVREAERRNVRIILTLGYKQPGWPECHQPGWAQNLDTHAKNEELLQFIGAVVERYKSSPAIFAWQIENEPFFVFGPDCEAVSGEQLEQEIAFVKRLDSRPIVLVDSGEKGTWLWAGKYGADIFGSTMYREAYHDKYGMYITYPIPGAFYRIKAGLLRTVYPDIDSVIGVELQGEPWFISSVFDTPWEEQKKKMNGQTLRDNAAYARRGGFAEHYFWGVEWWYWAKEKQNDPELWEAGKEIINPNS